MPSGSAARSPRISRTLASWALTGALSVASGTAETAVKIHPGLVLPLGLEPRTCGFANDRYGRVPLVAVIGCAPKELTAL